MYDRHRYVCDFIAKNVNAKTRAADIGCGSGVYVLKMLESRADFVYAFDYAKSAIDLTKKNLSESNQEKIEYKIFDITEHKIPKVDLAISIGVLPYIESSSITSHDALLPVVKTPLPS